MTPSQTDLLTRLNAAPRDAARAMIAPLAERSEWVADAAVDQRPFTSDGDVAAALIEVILAAPAARRVAMFRCHPELAGREAVAGRMTEESQGEQGRLGLMSLDAGTHRHLTQLNAAYEARFGYPCIIALHRVPDLDTLLQSFETRLTADPVEEHVTTLAEIASVIRARAARAFTSTPIPLTTP
ncbi:2-oxo-4-hydroxy-4-carboxy-5-ureidoimidazoline decarboxylase [Marinovum sp.]|uniref:2-oxo-4-hydroxy-4-carboxy-5-ureidoimidazoline decarboxylase n=1 Tax=Marinovum sp. TaxID=2024839 RepID=UPI002B2694E3|nr:2-oxo-4-hydroxy-4-carboxy-5-ureidoimidazoline decarboxylase [Marinovum sp.]